MTTKPHVTVILDGNGCQSQPDRSDGGAPYTASCLCGWRRAPLQSRKEAALVAKVHRVNSRVREEKA